MGLRALLNVSKGQQDKLTPMQTRVKGAPRSMNDPQAEIAPNKEAIEEVLRQCESPLLAYAIKMVRDGEQAQEIVQEARLCKTLLKRTAPTRNKSRKAKS